MILVDPRQLQQQQQVAPSLSSLPDATVGSLNSLDADMRRILETESTVEDADIFNKAKQYQQILQRYLMRGDQIKERPLGFVNVRDQQQQQQQQVPILNVQPDIQAAAAPDVVEIAVLDSVPAALRRKTTQLLTLLKRDPTFSWNERGEIAINGAIQRRTNLVDLLNDVLRKRRYHAQPEGWQHLAAALKRLNVPKELVGHPDRWAYIQRETAINQPPRLPISSALSSFFTPPPTPLDTATSGPSARRQNGKGGQKRKRKTQIKWFSF